MGSRWTRIVVLGLGALCLALSVNQQPAAAQAAPQAPTGRGRGRGAAPAVQTQAPRVVTVFEGARLIVGDGSPAIEDSAFVVENGRYTQVGRRGSIQVPE